MIAQITLPKLPQVIRIELQDHDMATVLAKKAECGNDEREYSPPDHCILVAKLAEEVPSPHACSSVPGDKTLLIPADLANGLAVQLNRLELRRGFPCWHIVALNASGKSAVVRIVPPSGWTPSTEYDMPSCLLTGQTKINSKKALKAINSELMDISDPEGRTWAFHVRELKPETTLPAIHLAPAA